MKPGIHPDYGYVVFRDKSAGLRLPHPPDGHLARRSSGPDGNNTYPVIDVEIFQRAILSIPVGRRFSILRPGGAVRAALWERAPR